MSNNNSKKIFFWQISPVPTSRSFAGLKSEKTAIRFVNAPNKRFSMFLFTSTEQAFKRDTLRRPQLSLKSKVVKLNKIYIILKNLTRYLRWNLIVLSAFLSKILKIADFTSYFFSFCLFTARKRNRIKPKPEIE